MKKYDLYFSREEIKNRDDVKPFSTFLSESADLVSSFDVKEDALQALSQYETVVKKTSAFSGKLEECLDLESDDHPGLYAVNQRTGSLVKYQ